VISVNKKAFITLLSLCLLFLSSCDVPETYNNSGAQLLNVENSESEETVVTEPLTEAVTTFESTVISTTVTTQPETEQVTTITTQAVTEKAEIIFPDDASLDLTSIPEYSNLPYIEVNADKPYFDVFTDSYFEKYPDLDILGRCGTVFEMLGPETMP